MRASVCVFDCRFLSCIFAAQTKHIGSTIQGISDILQRLFAWPAQHAPKETTATFLHRLCVWSFANLERVLKIVSCVAWRYTICPFHSIQVIVLYNAHFLFAERHQRTKNSSSIPSPTICVMIVYHGVLQTTIDWIQIPRKKNVIRNRQYQSIQIRIDVHSAQLLFDIWRHSYAELKYVLCE